MIQFAELNHSYSSIDPSNKIDWIGVSTLISHFKPGFDPVAGSIKASRNPKSKWYGLDPVKIQQIWKGESARSLEMGTWYHGKTEKGILSSDTFQDQDKSYSVIKPIVKDNIKYAPVQTLQEGHIYPEHMVYLQSEGICGQTDRVDVFNNLVNIEDYKTSKVIKQEGFKNWEGITARMKDPLSHLDDCSLVHYTLQMSLYLYMILKHNPLLKPGKLTLKHIIFELESEDQYGYPVYAKDANGEFIIKEIKPYEVPYLKVEVISILNFLKEYREPVKQTKIQTI